MSTSPINASLTMVPEDVLPSAWVGHLPFSFWLIEEARPDILVELGTHNGTSFLAFCQAIKARGTRTKAFAVDTWEGDEHAGHYGDEVHDRLQRVVQAKYAGFAQLMRMLFDDAMPYFSDGSVDLLHIDGLHTYDAVKHDFETWLPKMSRRGVIIFHDTMVREREFGVWQLWEELRGRYPSFEFKHTHGLGVLLVGDQPPAALAALCALSGTGAEAITSNLFDALGQRFSLLDKISQIEARAADAIQHAANYQAMYENADGSLRRAMDSFGAQLEGRRKEVEGASAQIMALMSALDALRVEVRAQLGFARRELGLPASSADAAEPPQALAVLVEELKALGAGRLADAAAADVERARLEQALATTGSELQAALDRLDGLDGLHGAELARLGVEFDGERTTLLRDRDTTAAEREAALQRLEELQAAHREALQGLDELQSRHAEAQASASAAYEAELSTARAAYETELSTTRARLEAALSAAVAAHDEAEAGLRAQLRQRDVQLHDLRSRLALRENEVHRLLSSHSWRITAPIRWLRGRWSALRQGTPAPSYADMLEAPVGGKRAALAGGDDAALAEAPGITAGYLEDLFADAASRRAPGYLGPDQTPLSPPTQLRAKAIAFYLPQFHCFPENEAWWGPGFTEWTNVTKAVPQFVGHEQPQLPADLGFYDLRVPEVLQRQVALARRYGIHGFCFHYYWFGGKRLMEQPLELFLSQPDLDFPFCLCWANENWTRRWDGREEEVLISQQHGPENDLAFIRDLERYLRDPRYIRIDGRPLLVVYRASLLPDPAATVERWRRHCRDAGIGEIFVAMAQFDAEDPTAFGFDAAVEFPPHKLAKGFDSINATLDVVNPGYQGSVFHYQSIVDSAKAWPDKGFPLVRSVFPGWDNEARRPGNGYTFAFSTPERYRDWLEFAVSYAQAHPVAGETIVMINAWNEWAEGAKLEPDARHGHAYLEATRQVLAAGDRQDGGPGK